MSKEGMEFKWVSRNLVQGFFHADEDREVEGWSLIFYSWGFMAFCLSCESSLCIVWCEFVCVCQSYERATWGQHTHILYRDNITLLWTGKRNMLECVALRTHTHTRIVSEYNVHAEGVKQVGGSKQYSMQPTTYNVWSFCFLRQWREREMSI